MRKIGPHFTIFLVVDTEGRILYCSDDIELIGLTNEDISDFIQNRTSIEGFDIKIEKIRVESEEFYAITITCKNTKKLLYFDVSTSLYNRNLWEWIKKNAPQHKSHDMNSLIIIDIDNLKEINDTYGHSNGDKCIKLVANSIKKCIRNDDLAFRFGGDEFIILLFNTTKGQAKRVVNRIKNLVRRKSNKHQLFISISAGISRFYSFDDLDKAFKKADKIMYQEKRNKKR